MEAATATEERLVGEKGRHEITGISRTTWWRLEREGTVPQPVRVGPGQIRKWLVSELCAWIREQAAERDRQRQKPKKNKRRQRSGGKR
ncbi:MAG: helix-turn-helix transcriptional regulator [Pseudomonadota bacterium]